MVIALYIIGAIVWHIIGVHMYAAVDRRLTILRWLRASPSFIITILSFTAWPIVVFSTLFFGRRVRYERKDGKSVE